MRQTIKVEDIVDYANKMLRIGAEECTSYPALASREYKEALCDIVEKILHMSGRYAGYQVIDSDNLEASNHRSPLYWKRKYYIKHK